MTAETSLQPGGRVPGQLLRWPAGDLARWSVGLLLGLLWCAALLVAWRRVAGALSRPLDPGTMLLVGLLVVMAAVAVRLLGRYFPLSEKASNEKLSRVGLLMCLSPTLAVLGLGAALSVPGTSLAGLIAFWSLAAAEELWAWRPLVLRVRRRAGSSRPVRVDSPEVPSPDALPVESSTSASSTASLEPASSSPVAMISDADILQQLIRSQLPDGGEQLSGWLRVPLSAGQRTASVHVAFCPPFPKTPAMEVDQLEGPELRIKTAQLLPHGVRLDLKLRHAAEQPLDVLLQFSARSPGG